MLASVLLTILQLAAILNAAPIEIKSAKKTIFARFNYPGQQFLSALQWDRTELNLPVGAGSQKKALTPWIDTASAPLWVPNTDNWVASSSSFKNLNRDFSNNYVLGNVRGYWANDNFKIGDVTLKGFSFAVVDPKVAGNTGSDQGLVGLRDHSDNIVYNLKRQRFIDDSVASIYYGQNDGAIIFGGYDAAKVSSAWASFPRTNEMWEVDIALTNINGKNMNVGKRFIYDTGSLISTFPVEIIKEIATMLNAQDNGDGYWIMKCGAGNGKTFTLKMGGIDFKIDLGLFQFPATTEVCYLGAANNKIAGGRNILGLPVLRSLHAILDMDNHVLKVAQIKNTAELRIVDGAK